MLDDFQRNKLRTTAGILILFFMMLRTGQFLGGPLLVTGRIIVFIIYGSFFALPRTWWDRKRIIILTAVLSVLLVLTLPLQNNVISIYMLITLTIPAIYIFGYPGYLYYLGVLVLEMFVLLTIFGHHDYPQSLPLIVLFVGLALSLRARILKREAYRISQLHLQELEKAHEELQQAAVATMQHAVLDERARIAREIHDAVGHSLTSLIVQLQALRYMLKDDPAQAQQSIEAMLSIARQGLTDIRVSVHALAADRSSLGITPLQALVSKVNATTNLKCSFVATPEAEDIPSEITTILFKVLQEGITNILRHSQATTVEINLFLSSKECVMTIEDNGKFTEESRFSEGFGLKSMRERVEVAGGSLEFLRGQPSGLTIKTAIPIGTGYRVKGE